MSNFSALKTAIQNAIKQNGNEEITGNLLQGILLSIVETLGDSAINTLETGLSNEASTRGNDDTQLNNLITGVKNNVDNGYVYAGIATPSTTPVSGKVFYIALQAGTYTNFGSQVVLGGITILKYNGSAWSKEQVLYTDGGVFDISAYNATGGELAKYANLTAALGTSGANIPQSIRKGGMSVKYVRTSDNKYVQFRCMAQSFTTDIHQWSDIDNGPTIICVSNTKPNDYLNELYISTPTGKKEFFKIRGLAYNSTQGLTVQIYNESNEIVAYCFRRNDLVAGQVYEMQIDNDSYSRYHFYFVWNGNTTEYGTSGVNWVLTDYVFNLRSWNAISSYLANNSRTEWKSAIAMINALGLTFGGIVSPTDSPASNDPKIVYLCSQKGVYSNFSNAVVNDGVCYLQYNSGNNKWWSHIITSQSKLIDGSNANLISLCIKELLVFGAKQSDNLYINNATIHYSTGELKINIKKDSSDVAVYWTNSGVFDDIIEFETVNDSGIKVYAIIDSNFECQVGGLTSGNGGLSQYAYSEDSNGIIAKYVLNNINTNVAVLTEKVDPSIKKWCTSDSINAYIKELYIPDASTLFPNGLNVERLIIDKSQIRLWFKNNNSDIVLACSVDLREYFNHTVDGSYREYYRSGAITPLYTEEDEAGLIKRIGYVKFAYNGTDYASTGNTRAVDYNLVTNIENSPSIKKMIENERQIVLLGGSHFGYPNNNILADIIQGITGIETFNLGFGGCQMCWRTTDGTSGFDVYSFPDIADALITQDFTKQRAQIHVPGGLGYAKQVANLEAIDITHPMQIITHFGDNDLTNNAIIGNCWVDDSNFDITDTSNVNAKLATLDRNKFCEAMTYALLRLFSKFPKLINYQALGLGYMYRVVNGVRYDTSTYRNSDGKSREDYNDALKENCKALGMRYNDYYNAGIMNAFSIWPTNDQSVDTGITLNGSGHYEPIGFAMFAQYLSNIARNFYAF